MRRKLKVKLSKQVEMSVVLILQYAQKKVIQVLIQNIHEI